MAAHTRKGREGDKERERETHTRQQHMLNSAASVQQTSLHATMRPRKCDTGTQLCVDGTEAKITHTYTHTVQTTEGKRLNTAPKHTRKAHRHRQTHTTHNPPRSHRRRCVCHCTDIVLTNTLWKRVETCCDAPGTRQRRGLRLAAATACPSRPFSGVFRPAGPPPPPPSPDHTPALPAAPKISENVQRKRAKNTSARPRVRSVVWR